MKDKQAQNVSTHKKQRCNQLKKGKSVIHICVRCLKKCAGTSFLIPCLHYICDDCYSHVRDKLLSHKFYCNICEKLCISLNTCRLSSRYDSLLIAYSVN